ncbi:MAG: ATP-dependent Clp protease ATP-binding subunit ClpA, partial [Myxococcales bacterium]|nr:ATP-dependent Clp protease ATP-binding subunit ClpA [Myxococcales bacterium]
MGRELQLTLQAALREAAVRRHAYVTVEHLLYAVLHDDRGADILRSCGADIPALKQELQRFFAEDVEIDTDSATGETRQTLAFHRVVQSAIAHVESAEKDEVEVDDLVAAIFQEPDSHAVGLLRNQGVSRLDILKFISHGIAKVPGAGDGNGGSPAGAPDGFDEEMEMDEGVDPLAAFSVNLSERASEGKLDPLVGREREVERIIHILARRRKNNPILVGETGVGKTALAEGLALRIHEGQVPADMQTAEIFSLDVG